MTAKETLTDVYRKYRAFMLEYDKAVQIKQADNAKKRGTRNDTAGSKTTA